MLHLIKWQIPHGKPIPLQLLDFQPGHIISPQRSISGINVCGRIHIGHVMAPLYSLICEVGIPEHQNSHQDSKVVGLFCLFEIQWDP